MAADSDDNSPNQPTEFHDSKPSLEPTQDSISEYANSQIGPYRLVRPIGEGGMGTVWLAEQREPVQRPVALKIIKAGMDTREVIARFEAERQALAMMNHPNIAKVLDAGATDNGRPFFVMEFVAGKPVTQYCDSRKMSLEERLEIFCSICHAVQHAHQKGIIHRDIKPSNVLVSLTDDEPQVKVIDFGLAKATSARLTEKTLFTQLGQMVGTPAYMSPEQADAGMDIDTRTDIYSLGVLLYEMLTGVTPIDSTSLQGAAYAEVQRIIREQEPPRMSNRLSSLGPGSVVAAGNRAMDPRRLAQRVRGDLDVIAMKALEKDRRRRYATPASFAEDIQRYLHREVIHARPASAMYRFRRLVERNQLLVTASSLVLLAMVVGTVVSLSQAVRATNAEKLAQQRLEEIQTEQTRTLAALADAEKERDRAVEAEELADTKTATALAINDFLKYDLLAEAAPSNNPRNEQITVEELVIKAAATIEEKFQDQPLVQADLRMTIGETLAALSNLPESEKQFEKAREILTRELGDEDVETILSVNNLGLIQKWQGKYDLAEANYKHALKFYRRVSGDLDSKTLGTINNLAMLYSEQGKYDLAEPLFLESLEGSRKVDGDEHPDTLQTMNNLAGLYRSMEKFDESEALLLESLAIRRRVLGEEHPDTLSTAGNLALWYQDQERYDDAVSLLNDTWEISRRVSGEEHFVTLIYKNNLARVYRDRGDIDRATELLEQVVKSRRKVLGEQHGHTLGTILTLANLYRDQGRFEESKPLYRDRIRIIGEVEGDKSSALASALNSFGDDLIKHEEYPQARKVLEECLTIQRSIPTTNPLQIAHVESLLAATDAIEAEQLVASDPDQAAETFSKAEKVLLESYETVAESDFAKTQQGGKVVAGFIDRIMLLYRLRNEAADANALEEWQAKRDALFDDDN